MRIGFVVGLLGLGLLAYFTFAPIPADPQTWEPPVNPGRTGAFATNKLLAKLEHLPLGQDQGPEHIVAHDGWIYTGLASGAVVRVRADDTSGTPVEVLLNTGGRPLGLAFDNLGALYIADAFKGLLRARADSNGSWSVETIATQVDDATGQDPIHYADAVLAASDGTVYFTDASKRFAPKDWGDTFHTNVLDTLEHSCTGRVLAYDPATKYTRVVMRDLCFPNGLAPTRDGSQLLLSETGSYRIWKINLGAHGLSAKQALRNPTSEASILIANLPGFPDNLTRGQDGRVWCGLTKPRSALIDLADKHPWLRSITLRLPQALWPVPKPYGQVFAFDDNGQILLNLEDPQGAYPETTAATETAGRIYIQSLNARTLAWLDKKALGL